MVNLIGTYECKVDAKGRLMVPAPMKKQLVPIMQEGFVLKRSVFNPCLELYPLEQWNKEMEKIGELNQYVKENVDFIRMFTAGVKLVDVDTNGRLLIPKDLVRVAKINKEVVLNSSIGKVEIWDKELYEKSIDTPAEEFAALAERVMGNKNRNGNELP
ncbi:division/cell wall cluster transcriptional repressor MraZ [Salinimicrobium sp. TH3]|uniref:division/cell wall cluster transcriptional repressor MraZ n=1 Tax=Salinimicrobium sp. TH3 TaxID=2997342 RepID=UPI002276F7E5|nr:division/cell wall cluster transcriptional repressor MraZ [Salinimicrobium sp. TH3]MCY2686088.1 division/cell wall cluster transcriptional repressor MraZ [Salinimicrobium sp. TH3]